jgi:sec-independent protein translocase protein TatA
MPFGGTELVILLAIVLLLFGAKRIPQLAKSLGIGAREFQSELKNAASEDAAEGETKAASDKAEESRTFPPEDASSESEGSRSAR